jgi:hypothetical protein
VTYKNITILKFKDVCPVLAESPYSPCIKINVRYRETFASATDPFLPFSFEIPAAVKSQQADTTL